MRRHAGAALVLGVVFALGASTVLPANAADAGASGACGSSGQPECPLQAFMRHELEPPLLVGDTQALAAAFDRLATFAPPGFDRWSSIARDGAAAARAGELGAAKATCRACHGQYRAEYRQQHRARPL